MYGLPTYSSSFYGNMGKTERPEKISNTSSRHPNLQLVKGDVPHKLILTGAIFGALLHKD